jgi:hypothetical protein
MVGEGQMSDIFKPGRLCFRAVILSVEFLAFGVRTPLKTGSFVSHFTGFSQDLVLS